MTTTADLIGTDEVLSGLAVYSRDYVELGRIAGVVTTASVAPDSLAGRQIAIDPSEQVRAMLHDEDLVVSESMIFDTAPEQDRVILNVSARRVVAASRHRNRPV